MSKSVHDLVATALAESSDAEIAAEDITAEMLLREDLLLDSLGALSLMMDMEDEFGVTIDENDIKEMRTVGDVVSTVQGLVEKERNTA